MKFCKKTHRNKGNKVVLSKLETALVTGGTNGNGLDPTDTKTQAKTKLAPIVRTKVSGG